MFAILVCIFLILHGLVHLWYVVLSLDLVEFDAEMGWTGESWLLSTFLSHSLISIISNILYTLSAVLFVIGGISFAMDTGWSKPLLIITSILSSLVIILFWDGNATKIVEKGLIGLIINIVIIGLLVFQD